MYPSFFKDFQALSEMLGGILIARNIHSGIAKPEQVIRAAFALGMVCIIPIYFVSAGSIQGFEILDRFLPLLFPGVVLGTGISDLLLLLGIIGLESI